MRGWAGNASTPKPIIMRSLLTSQALPYILLCASAAVTLYQRRTINTLTNTIETIKAEGRLKPGKPYGPLSFQSATGAKETLHFPRERPVLAYLVSPTCGWCKKNRPVFMELASKVASSFDVVVLWTDVAGPELLQEYRGTQELRHGVLSAETRSAYRLSGTPSTLLISNSGLLLDSLPGAYSGDTRSKIEALLKVQLTYQLAGMPSTK